MHEQSRTCGLCQSYSSANLAVDKQREPPLIAHAVPLQVFRPARHTKNRHLSPAMMRGVRDPAKRIYHDHDANQQILEHWICLERQRRGQGVLDIFRAGRRILMVDNRLGQPTQKGTAPRPPTGPETQHHPNADVNQLIAAKAHTSDPARDGRHCQALNK